MDKGSANRSARHKMNSNAGIRPHRHRLEPIGARGTAADRQIREGRAVRPPHPPYGHLLPEGRRGNRDVAAYLFSPRGEGAGRRMRGPQKPVYPTRSLEVRSHRLSRLRREKIRRRYGRSRSCRSAR
ncbi:hypothetical protein B5P46_15880 [Rhizobium leguminosarum]|uniref:Uncharacterized protein n=1 Tax=Rhizobium leguminosarum TaxID=384 RepID=A0A4Q1TZW3_RHILE|nr:hypothetical protein B5P46_15880 [Rhizobium leguminosarum]